MSLSRIGLYEKEMSQKKMKLLNLLKILVSEFFDKQVDEKQVNSIFT